MTLTGSNADYRQYIKPAQEKKMLIKLYNELVAKLGGNKIKELKCGHKLDKFWVKDLIDNKGKSLVVSGTNGQEHSNVGKCYQQFVG